MNSYVVDVKIYRHDVIFVQGDEQESIEYLKENFDIDEKFLKENINECCGGSTMLIYPQIIFIWVRDEITDKITDNIDLLHEITHATSFIMRYLNTPLIQETEECFAYLNSYITTVLFEQVESENIKEEAKKKKCTPKKKPVKKVNK